MKFHCFYVSATRWRFCKLIKNANNLLQHEALKGTNVHEMTLCVTFGAPQFRTHVRFFVERSKKYVFWHACPPEHTVRNVWRASPFDSVRPLGPHPWALGPPRPPRDSKRFRLATIWAGNVARGCPPDITSACPRLHPDLRSDIFPLAGAPCT